MSFTIKTIINGLTKVFTDYQDPRVDDWFLMGSPFPGLVILVLYLYYVLDAGPQFMKNRKPYSLEKLLIYYNAVQIVSSGYVVIALAKYALFKYSWVCAPIDFSSTPDAIFVGRVIWFYTMLKFVDLLDTVFFVLRKKNNQISFLHVYHHAGMVILGWIGTKFLAGGHTVYIPFVNSMVHCIMYFYYLLTAWNKSYKQSLWWKKYITQMQLVQFALLLVIYTQLIFQHSSKCGYPRWIGLFLFPQNLFITSLFADFYIKTYIKKSPKKPEQTLLAPKDININENGKLAYNVDEKIH